MSATRRRWTGRLVWDGRALAENGNWITVLTEAEVDAVRAAVDAARSSGAALGELTRRDFDLGPFGERLLALRDEILDGRGFALIRGLPHGRWSDEDLVYAYWGIGSWLGVPVPQNAQGHLLGHVIDRRGPVDGATRIYQTRRLLPFHSDSCDLVGLLCLRRGRSGGASALASAAAVHNRLIDADPSALETLYGEFQCDRFDEIPEGKLPWYAVRIFNEVDGRLVCCGMDPDVRSAQRLEDVAPLTPAQVRALDAFQSAARTLALEMTLEPGDIQLVNNLVVVHARDSFEDFPEPERRRYMVRLWLSSPLGRALPAFLSERWGSIEVGHLRGGIRVPGATPVVELDPDR